VAAPAEIQAAKPATTRIRKMKATMAADIYAKVAVVTDIEDWCR
jgi:hypothetical protein